MTYEMLRSKHHIGSLEIKNRVVLPALGVNLTSGDGEVSDHYIRYFEERAMGGVGLIITEIALVDPEFGKPGAAHPRVDDGKFIPMLNRLAEVVQKYDTKIFVQLFHAGRQSVPALNKGQEVVAPSPIACKFLGEVPRALTIKEIEELVNKFVMAASRCQMAGMDGVELHGAHGFLIDQFLSPYTNQRNDVYGGSLENRMRFLKEIVKGIKGTCGQDYPVIVRLSAEEFVEGGIDLTMSREIARGLEKIGVDGLNVSCGIMETLPTFIEAMSYEQGWKVYLAEGIKEVVDIPVIAVGVIREPAYAEKILKEGRADFVALARAHLADPQWVTKALQGREKEIRKCISCNHCTNDQLYGRHVHCAINARTGREMEFQRLLPAEAGRKVVVVGGGPGGMEAARVLAERGYKVILFEAEGELGGKLDLATRARGKEKIRWLRDYLTSEMERLQVDVRLSTPVTLATLQSESPDAVIMATGSKVMEPDIVGMEAENTCLAEDVLKGNIEINNENVVVSGGGSTGCETAELLARQGNAVTLVEMKPEVATDIDIINRMVLMEKLQENNVSILTGCKLVEVRQNRVVLMDIGKEETLEKSFDKLVLALGYRSNDEVLNSVIENFEKVEIIGDLKKPRKIADAMREGFEKAYLL